MTPRLPHVEGDLDVLDVLVRRRADGSQPGDRDDPHRVALVVEGGGMRGAYLGGMIKALHDNGFRPSFDEIVAVSAGAFSAAGLVTGDTSGAVSVYADDLATGGFVSWQRYLSGRGPLVSLEFLIDAVMTGRQRFRWAALTTSDLPLRPVATPLDTLQAEVLTGMASGEDWKRALRASASIPVLAGPPGEYHGRTYIDGFAGDALPIARAVAAGASHVLALISRAPGERLKGAGRPHPVVRRRLDRITPGLGELMGERGASYAASLALVSDRDHSARGSARILALRAAWSAGVRALTTDQARLWRAGDAGAAAVTTAFTARA